MRNGRGRLWRNEKSKLRPLAGHPIGIKLHPEPNDFSPSTIPAFAKRRSTAPQYRFCGARRPLYSQVISGTSLQKAVEP
jgi:hypothetical protein